MAHECPDCGQVCFCNGDIDDLILNLDADVIRCHHCPSVSDDDDCDEPEAPWWP
jgi:primosomal protein N'